MSHLSQVPQVLEEGPSQFIGCALLDGIIHDFSGGASHYSNKSYPQRPTSYYSSFSPDSLTSNTSNIKPRSHHQVVRMSSAKQQILQFPEGQPVSGRIMTK